MSGSLLLDTPNSFTRASVEWGQQRQAFQQHIQPAGHGGAADRAAEDADQGDADLHRGEELIRRLSQPERHPG